MVKKKFLQKVWAKADGMKVNSHVNKVLFFTFLGDNIKALGFLKARTCQKNQEVQRKTVCEYKDFAHIKTFLALWFFLQLEFLHGVDFPWHPKVNHTNSPYSIHFLFIPISSDQTTLLSYLEYQRNICLPISKSQLPSNPFSIL